MNQNKRLLCKVLRVLVLFAVFAAVFLAMLTSGFKTWTYTVILTSSILLPIVFLIYVVQAVSGPFWDRKTDALARFISTRMISIVAIPLLFLGILLVMFSRATSFWKDNPPWDPSVLGAGVSIIALAFALAGLSSSRRRETRADGTGTTAPNASPVEEGSASEDYRDIHHEVLADRKGIYYMGETLGFSARLTNLFDQNCTREFLYCIQLPDGMRLFRPIAAVSFGPGETKTIRLGQPIFLAFLGTFRVVVMTGEEAFLSLFAGYSRDKEGYELQKKTVCLTKVLGVLTLALVALTIALIVLTVKG